MKIRSPLRLTLALLLYTVCSSAFPESLDINPDAIVGEWQASEHHPEQGNIDTRFLINADKTFSGSMTINDAPVWQYSGTWELEGNRVTWVYLESSTILLQEDMADTDVILSVTENAMTYRSVRRGKERTLQRVK
jgi:hypothetical protein